MMKVFVAAALGFYLFASSTASVAVVPAFGECSASSTCASGTLCTSKDVGICQPLAGFNTTRSPTLIDASLNPVSLVSKVTDDTPVETLLICIDDDLQGGCAIWSLACDFCFGLGDGWTDDVSSVEILVEGVGCNLWPNADCTGVGASMDYIAGGGYYNLGGTQFNDATVAANCFCQPGYCDS